ncbi:hypothetical protein AADZ86_05685 [Colwelliaceae bacterium BS250]
MRFFISLVLLTIVLSPLAPAESDNSKFTTQYILQKQLCIQNMVARLKECKGNSADECTEAARKLKGGCLIDAEALNAVLKCKKMCDGYFIDDIAICESNYQLDFAACNADSFCEFDAFGAKSSCIDDASYEHYICSQAC